jgi:hypothetical protein
MDLTSPFLFSSGDAMMKSSAFDAHDTYVT